MRFVYASSSSIYGDAETLPTPEDAHPAPDLALRPDQAQRRAPVLSCTRANYGLDSVSLRYFTVFGPRQRPDMAFNIFCRAALEGRPMTVFGDGRQTRDFTYVADVVAATVAAGEAELGEDRVFNIGGGSPTSVRAVLDQIAELSRGPPGRELSRSGGRRREGHGRRHVARTVPAGLRSRHLAGGGTVGGVRLDEGPGRARRRLELSAARAVIAADYGGPYAGSFMPMLRAAMLECEARGLAVTAVLPAARGGTAEWLSRLAAEPRCAVRCPPARGRIRSSGCAGFSPTRPARRCSTRTSAGFDMPGVAAALGRPRVRVIWHTHTVLSESRTMRVANRVKLGAIGRRVERILCVGPHLADDVIARGARPERMSYFPNGLDTSATRHRRPPRGSPRARRSGSPPTRRWCCTSAATGC